MVRLSLLTEPSTVHQSIAEFGQLGRDAFLARYGFERSRDYFVRAGDSLIDSKPLVAAAFARQYPEHPALTAVDFSGGSAGAVRALQRLGFDVVTRAQLRPPRLGDDYADRTDVYETYGGDKVAGVVRFPGDAIVNVFSDADGPYADEAPSINQPFGYRGEGLRGRHRVADGGGNALLERARLERDAVRFWYRPSGGRFSFLTWAVVLGRSWVPGVGADGVSREELEWSLAPTPLADRDSWPSDVAEQLSEAQANVADSAQVAEAQAQVTFAELLARLDELGQERRPGTGVVRVNLQRSAAARRAVLLRAAGRCESARCTGMPAEVNRRGEPILDVDHIDDLALGGEDHPRNMVALCPNCHASKTRGAQAARWRRELRKVASEANARAVARS